MNTKFRLDINRAALLIIDVQEKLVPAMNQPLYTQLLQNARLLREGFTAFGRPVLATEQYPQGLGHTISELNSGITATVAKRAFSCCGETDFLTALEKTGADQVVVIGMETHVCVYQTVLDLLDKGYAVHLVRDAVASRFVSDFENALRLAGEAGAVVTTTETALFQFVPVAEGDGFKTISKLVRTRTA
nr:isochorismatase family protein [Pelobacter seleniigenes]